MNVILGYKMIRSIRNEDNYFSLLKDDPVRATIPNERRIGANKEVLVLLKDQDPVDVLAVVCVSLQNNIPKTENELFETTTDPTVAIFYTIWSYAPGSAGSLIFNAVDFIKEKYNSVSRFVTLSPKTEMAKKFHIKNGACVLSDNESSVNYEYKV